jgi:hypothetical protein
MSRFAKWSFLGAAFIGMSGALAHDIFNVSKAAIAIGFMVFGIGFLCVIYLQGRA